MRMYLIPVNIRLRVLSRPVRWAAGAWLNVLHYGTGRVERVLRRLRVVVTLKDLSISFYASCLGDYIPIGLRYISVVLGNATKSTLPQTLELPM